MAYLTYVEYTGFGFSDVTSAEFPKFEFLAEATLDWYTFNRLQSETTLSDRIKQLMCVLVDLMKKRNDAMSLGAKSDSTGNTSAGYVTSQSNDGVSISYNGMDANNIYIIAGNECKSIIDQQLQGVMNSAGHKLLYRGLYPGE